jgi:uncharacterized protein YqfA (UPF0365 family)
VLSVVDALIAANRARIELPFDIACAIDLAGATSSTPSDLRGTPRSSTSPTPNTDDPPIDGVAKDGIQLKARARVTVRANIQRLVGGATEETIVARVGEGIVSSIGSAETHKEVLESPDRISKTVLERGLDCRHRLRDPLDRHRGHRRRREHRRHLQTDQAEADKKRFQAEAEKRRALAMAQEQEFKAEEQKNRALVVLAEAEVPKAMADAFRQGHLGIVG